jgi:hypothetical protein
MGWKDFSFNYDDNTFSTKNQIQFFACGSIALCAVKMFGMEPGFFQEGLPGSSCVF